jgi:hypothetical protein
VRETNILQLCRIEASNCGALVWRNNTGKAYAIDTVKALIKAAFTLNLQAVKNAINKLRIISFGLCVGSSDLIGMYRGRFLAMEIKIPGERLTVEQQNFIDIINAKGGIAGVVTCPEDVRSLLKTID